MIDKKSVVRALECCLGAWREKCPDDCPYLKACMSDSVVMYKVMDDALTLLKEQDEGVEQNG